MTGFQGFPPRPNLTGYTAVPNVFFDEVLPTINSMSELKILLIVFRKTYGWVKEIDPSTGQPIYKLEDEISYSQFEKLTGLSNASVSNGVQRAIEDGYLEKVQQGNYSGKTNGYRVVTSGGAQIEVRRPQKPTNADPQKKPQVQYLDVDKGDIDVPKRFGTSIADVMGAKQDGVAASYQQDLSPEKKDILGEIFGSTAPKQPEPKKEKKSTPHQEFIKNWTRCYRTKINLAYGNINGKEHGHIKSLLKDYNIDMLVKAMEFYMDNYQNLDGLPSAYPSITIFYSWRKKIIPSSQNGIIPRKEKPSRNAREFNEDKFNKGEDFFDN